MTNDERIMQDVHKNIEKRGMKQSATITWLWTCTDLWVSWDWVTQKV